MYSIDFIRRALIYKDEGHTFTELKAVFGIPRQTYYIWKKKYENGFPKTRKKIVRTRKRKIDKAALERALAEKPDASLSELAKLFNCTDSAIFYALKRWKITLKKKQ